GAGLLWTAVSCSGYVLAALSYVFASIHALEYPVLLAFIFQRIPSMLGRSIAAIHLLSMAMTAGMDRIVGKLIDAHGMTAAMNVLPIGYVLFSAIAAAVLVYDRYVLKTTVGAAAVS